jgi:hypothetical protein
MGFPLENIAPSPARMSPWTIALGGTAVPPNRLSQMVRSRRIPNFQEAVAAFSFIFLGKDVQQPPGLYVLIFYPEKAVSFVAA